MLFHAMKVVNTVKKRMGWQKTTKKNFLHSTLTDSDNNNLNMATMKKLASISIIGKA